jgi:hypothetical protein
MQAYSDPGRESDPYALPDVEVFHVRMVPHVLYDCGCCGGFHRLGYDGDCRSDADRFHSIIDYAHRAGVDSNRVAREPVPEPGWYWWPCFPGCLPDSDPVGPFDTEEEALADARDGWEGGDDDEA